MCDATGLSQRRACRLTGLSLSTCRYDAQRPAADAHLSGRITELALERRRFGYRRIWQLLRREGLLVNHKRVYRLYHLNGLGVKRRRRRKGGPLGKRKLSHAKTVFCTKRYRLYVMSGIFRIPA